jgi:chemotaxis protein CheX
MVAGTQQPNIADKLQEAASQTIETMVFLTPSSANPCESHADRSTNDQVIGILGFTGSKSGTFVARTSDQLARTMAAKMLMMDTSELGGFDEVADAFGEIVNMMAGCFKESWIESGHRMDLSIPNVIKNGSDNFSTNNAYGISSSISLAIDGQFVDLSVYFEA